MPFINITFAEANRILKEPEFIIELLKEKKINPKEADLLELISKQSQKQSSARIEEIQKYCKHFFGEEADSAFHKLSRFIESENKRVSWVLFSRHFQSIKYDDRDPLEEYNPRVSEVLTISSKYKVIK